MSQVLNTHDNDSKVLKVLRYDSRGTDGHTMARPARSYEL